MNKYLKKLAWGTLIPLILGLVTGFTYVGNNPKTASAACGGGYSYCYTLTIPHANVAPNSHTALTNFDILFSTSTMSTLATSGHSGLIQHTVAFNGQTVPADMVFSTTSNCGSLMYWDFENYSSTTGESEVWILNTTALSTITPDTTLTMCVDNSSVSTYQGGTVGQAWPSSYRGVWHVSNGTTFSGNDSTTYNNTVVTQGTAGANTGYIDGGLKTVGGGVGNNAYVASTTAFNVGTGDFTYSGWMKNANLGSESILMGWYDGTNYVWLEESGSNKIRFRHSGVDISGVTTIDGNWHFLVVTRTGGNAYVYLDANSATSGGDTNTASMAAGTNPSMGITMRNDGYGYSIGSFDELRVNAAYESPDWISTEYNNQSSPSTFVTVGAQQSSGGGGTTPKPQIIRFGWIPVIKKLHI